MTVEYRTRLIDLVHYIWENRGNTSVFSLSCQPCSASTRNATQCVDDIHTTCDDMQCFRIDDMQPAVDDIHAARDFIEGRCSENP